MIEHKKFEPLQYEILKILGVNTDDLIEADRVALDSLLERTFRHGYEVACKNDFEMKNKPCFTEHELISLTTWYQAMDITDPEDDELYFRIRKLLSK